MNPQDCNTCQPGQVGGKQFVWIVCGADTCAVSAYKEVFQNAKCERSSVYFDKDGVAIICEDIRETDPPVKILNCTPLPPVAVVPPFLDTCGDPVAPGARVVTPSTETKYISGTNVKTTSDALCPRSVTIDAIVPTVVPGTGVTVTSVVRPDGGTNYTVNATPAAVSPQAINGVTSGQVSMLGGGLVFTPNGDDSFTITENCIALQAFIAACNPALTADLSIVKTQTSGTVNVGAPFTYTLVVTNNGPSPANNATVGDALPPSFVLASESVTYAGGAAGLTGAAGTYTIGTFPVGGSATITINGSFNAAGNVSNTAMVSPPAGVTDTNPANNTSTVAATVNAVAPGCCLAFGAPTVTPNPVPAGTNFSVSVRVDETCGAPALAGVATLTGLPAGITFVSLAGQTWPGLPAVGFRVMNWTLNNASATALNVNAVAHTTFPVGTCPADLPVPFTTLDAVVQQADLSIVKTASVASVNVGDPFAYTLVVTNNGPDAANGATVADTLPATFVPGAETVTPAGGAAGVTGSAGAYTIGTLPSGGSVTVVINGTFNAAGTAVNNTATVAPPAGVNDPVPGNNTSSIPVDVTAIVLPQADLSIVKTDSVGSAFGSSTPGGTKTFDLLITNNGPDAANGAVIKDATNIPANPDPFAAAVSYTGGASGPATVTTAQLAAGFTIPVFPSGATVRIEQVGFVYNTVASGTNTGTVATPPGTTDPTPGDSTSTIPVNVVSGPPPPTPAGYGCPPLNTVSGDQFDSNLTPAMSASSLQGNLVTPGSVTGGSSDSLSSAWGDNTTDCSEVANGASLRILIPTTSGNYTEYIDITGSEPDGQRFYGPSYPYTWPTQAQLTALGYGTVSGQVDIRVRRCVHCLDGSEGPMSQNVLYNYIP